MHLMWTYHGSLIASVSRVPWGANQLTLYFGLIFFESGGACIIRDVKRPWWIAVNGLLMLILLVVIRGEERGGAWHSDGLRWGGDVMQIRLDGSRHICCCIESTYILISHNWLVLIKGWLKNLWILDVLVVEITLLRNFFILIPLLFS